MCYRINNEYFIFLLLIFLHFILQFNCCTFSTKNGEIKKVENEYERLKKKNFFGESIVKHFQLMLILFNCHRIFVSFF